MTGHQLFDTYKYVKLNLLLLNRLSLFWEKKKKMIDESPEEMHKITEIAYNLDVAVSKLEKKCQNSWEEVISNIQEIHDPEEEIEKTSLFLINTRKIIIRQVVKTCRREEERLQRLVAGLEGLLGLIASSENDINAQEKASRLSRWVQCLCENLNDETTVSKESSCHIG